MPETHRAFAVLGAVFALVAVAAGAFGSHGLRGRLDPVDLAIFETAVRYQMYHALALVGAAWVGSQWPGGAATLAGWAFVAGSLVFCGSLYLMVLTDTRWLGAITPLGGVMFMVGWAAMAWAVARGAG